ncbi:MAG: hypothetical protein AB7O57_03555 [Hyphomicrobiaceae bacterium]
MPPEIAKILLMAIANPATLATGLLMGRRADQPQKIVVIAFAAGLAGTLLAWLLMMVGLYAPDMRLLSGVFIASAVAGAACAWIGYLTRPRSPGPR